MGRLITLSPPFVICKGDIIFTLTFLMKNAYKIFSIDSSPEGVPLEAIKMAIAHPSLAFREEKDK